MAYQSGRAPMAYSAPWLQAELDKIARAQTEPVPFAFLEPQTVPPAKPRNGMIVLAAAPWDPGAGAGYYGYWSGAWAKL